MKARTRGQQILMALLRRELHQVTFELHSVRIEECEIDGDRLRLCLLHLDRIESPIVETLYLEVKVK